MSHPTIAISMGDPAGIGPEVTLKALADDEVRRLAEWILVGDRWIVEQLGAQIGCLPARGVTLLDRQQLPHGQLEYAKVNADCGRAGLDYVRAATELCLAGRADAMVTAPLNKEAVAAGGISFCGHTEYIADLCGAPDSRMLLYNEQIRVVHVSTHVSLLEATRLSTERIVRTIQLGHDALVRLGWDQPRIHVCGLNPHAGENGMFGDEEAEFIAPAVAQAHAAGMNCEGPFPADTVFMLAARGACDLVVAMYHDQGHVAMKLLDFEHTVNVSLGLPIIRVSVDHGTAFEIAGKNQADATDMKTTMRLAVRIAKSAAFSTR